MSQFLILSDYPAIADFKRSLNDNHGRMFWHLLYTQGFPSADTSVEFLYKSPGDVRSGFNDWRAIEAKHKPKVILALGQTVIRDLGLEGSINDLRGSVIKMERKRDCWVIPMFNPRDLKKPMRMFADEKLDKAYFTMGDIKRAVRTYYEGWKVPKEKFNLNPTLKNVLDFFDKCNKEKPLIGCDLEATGLSIEHSKIVVMGFALNEEEALVLPILAEGGREYWVEKEWRILVPKINHFFRNNKFIFQNGIGYDVPLLRARGWDFPLKSLVEDTLVLHHVLAPELPHKIGFISSQYGKLPFWKDSFLKKKISILETDQLEMKRYNARDCVALHQIRNGMRKEIKERKKDPIWSQIDSVYKQEMAVARVLIEMFEEGITLDQRKLTEWRKKIDKEVDEKERSLLAVAELPAGFSFGSPDQMRLLLYGERPKGIEGVLGELEKYDLECYNYQYECAKCGRKVTKKFYINEKIPTSRLARCPACKKEMEVKRTEKEPSPVKGLSKETQKYIDLSKKRSLAETAPLYRLNNYHPLMTKTGNNSAIDKGAITRYIVAIDKRLDTIQGMKRRLPKHEEEAENLKGTKKFLVAFAEYGTVKKLQESFYEFPTWRDGRVRPHFMVTGTNTGRLSCTKPNLMQTPAGEWGKYVRSCFRAGIGKLLLSVDFTGLEVVVGAYIIGDDVLKEQLNKGLNLHDENTKTFFNVTKSAPNWKDLRGAAKVIQFASIFYGGSDNGIFSKVITEVPNSGITLKSFKKALQNYRNDHPAYEPWVERVQEQAENDRVSVNAFGRVRTLLGEANSNTRIALNNPIQGSAADIVGSDMVELSKLFHERHLGVKILLQIHDELLFEVSEKDLKEVSKIIQRVMNKKRIINGYSFRIPLDAEIGTHWGLMEGFDLKTGKKLGASKH